MEKFISLATDPDFQPFQWSWPGNHQPMHATMIMLIDIYERPYSPEAPKSRAFVDKIFSLTGPDGGVVGGEDGISTQRPLKDGGREAWDMIRRLRQKGWQKAGLDPQKLWTEQAQIQAGVAVPEQCLATNPYYSGSSAYLQPIQSREKLMDFSKMFYNMTRSQALPSIAAALGPAAPLPRTSPPRYEIPSKPMPPPQLHHPSAPIPPSSTSPTDVKMTTSPIPPSQNIIPPPQPVPPTLPLPQHPPVPTSPRPPHPHTQTQQQHQQLQQQQEQQQLQTFPPFFETIAPSEHPMNLSVPTPPSMVDPNLNFDWDQWDAVFGQHLPVSDELMELDPVTGFEFGDLGVTGRANQAGPSFNGGDSQMGMGGAGMRNPGWNGF